MRTASYKKGNTVYQFEIGAGSGGRAEARERLHNYMTLAMLSKDLALGLQEISEMVNREFLTFPSQLVIDGVAQLRDKQCSAVSLFDKEFEKRREDIISSVMRDVKEKHNVVGLGTKKTQRFVRSRLVSAIDANVDKQRKTVVSTLQMRALFVYFAKAVEKQRLVCGAANISDPLYRDFSQENALQWCVHMHDVFRPMMDDADFPLTSDILYSPVLSTLNARHQFDQIDINVHRLEFLMRRYIQYEVLEQTAASALNAGKKVENSKERKQEEEKKEGTSSRTTLPHSAIEMIRERGVAFFTTEMSLYTQQHEAYKWLHTLLKIHSTYRKMERMLNNQEVRDNLRFATGLREKFIGRLCEMFDSLPEKEVVRRTMMLLRTYMHAESTDWKQRIGLNLTTTCDIQMSCNVLNDVMTTYDILQATLYTSIVRARRMYDTLSELSYSDVNEQVTKAFGKQIAAQALC